jgi:hypothetical protein
MFDLLSPEHGGSISLKYQGVLMTTCHIPEYRRLADHQGELQMSQMEVKYLNCFLCEIWSLTLTDSV